MVRSGLLVERGEEDDWAVVVVDGRFFVFFQTFGGSEVLLPLGYELFLIFKLFST